MEHQVHSKKKKKLSKTTQILNKNIFYTVFNNKKGLGYISFKNQESKFKLSVKVILSGSKSVGLLSQGNPEYSEVQVLPGEVKSLVFLASDIPYNLKLQLMNSVVPLERFKKKKIKIKPKFKKFSYADELMKHGIQVKQPQDNQIKQNQDIQIKQKLFENKKSFEILNKSQMVYNITLVFSLVNCKFESSQSKTKVIILLPGEKLTFVALKTKKTKPFTAKITKKIINLLGV